MNMKKQEHNNIVCMNYLGELYQKYEHVDKTRVMEIQDECTMYHSNEFCMDMERILNELPEVFKEIIKNDFLMVENLNWWQNKYDKQTYQELKNMAVRAFFHCLYV